MTPEVLPGIGIGIGKRLDRWYKPKLSNMKISMSNNCQERKKVMDDGLAVKSEKDDDDKIELS